MLVSNSNGIHLFIVLFALVSSDSFYSAEIEWKIQGKTFSAGGSLKDAPGTTIWNILIIFHSYEYTCVPW